MATNVRRGPLQVPASAPLDKPSSQFFFSLSLLKSKLFAYSVFEFCEFFIDSEFNQIYHLQIFFSHSVASFICITFWREDVLNLILIKSIFVFVFGLLHF